MKKKVKKLQAKVKALKVKVTALKDIRKANQKSFDALFNDQRNLEYQLKVANKTIEALQQQLPVAPTASEEQGEGLLSRLDL
jgi:peptidoglycan hydrolase CwlO-like protein